MQSCAVITTEFATTKNYYVNPSTGLDSNNGETSSTPWLTIEKAINHIADHYVVTPGEIVINLAKGEYTPSSTLSFAHRCGQAVSLVGPTPLQKNVQAVYSVTSRTPGNQRATLTLSDTTNVAAGDYILIDNPTGGTNEEALIGAHKIESVSGNRIAVIVKSQRALPTSINVVQANCKIIQTVIKDQGIKVDGFSLKAVKNIVFSQAATNQGIAVYAKSGALNLENVWTDGFRRGFASYYKGLIKGTGLAACGAGFYGVDLQYGSVF